MADRDSGFDDGQIFEPLQAYAKVYKEKFEENANTFFDQLIEQSGINVEANRATNKKINKLIPIRDNMAKHISRRKGLRLLLVILAIVSIIVLIFTGIQLSNQFNIGSLIALIISIAILVIFPILIFKGINPGLKRLKEDKAKVLSELDGLIKEASGQMAPLNRLFYQNMGVDLFKQTVPLINLDNNFDSRRLDYLKARYGLDDHEDLNKSALYVQSGDINGNPFYICNDLVHELGTKNYSGSITIRWTTTTRGPKGQTIRKTNTQVLTATINKPCPYYNEQPYLVYGNEAAPDLTFSRKNTDVENMSEKQIQRKVKRKIKQIKKKAEKNIRTGGNFTVLGNHEFEVIFNAIDRNNEAQFRLLFTPLAQKQLLQIMKEKTYGYGDDFDFYKMKKINVLYPKHLRKINLNISLEFFKGIDIDVMRDVFVTYQKEWFRQMYFTLAPMISIPLYQQLKPQEFIYKDLYPSYVSFYEHEMCVNRMNQNDFKHPLSGTQNILKTKVVKSGQNHDTINVTAYGYQTANKVEMVSRMGGDGRMHIIPVSWVEYTPVQKVTTVDIEVPAATKSETPAEKIRRIFEDLKDGNIENNQQAARIGTLLARVVENNSGGKK